MSVEVKPYKEAKGSKKEQVAEMFDTISPRYDFLNHLLSLRIDKIWRKKAVKLIAANKPKNILDIATGTGDFAIESLKLDPDQVVGVDISNGMLEKGKEKMLKKGHDKVITLQYGDSEKLPFDSEQFDAITVGFGVRNFENLELGLSEMLRVLKNGGIAAILEFSKPHKFPVKQSYNFYSKHVIPRIGKTVSKDNAAYTYLPESVAAFPEGEDFLTILRNVGYSDVAKHSVSGGIATIYTALKKE